MRGFYLHLLDKCYLPDNFFFKKMTTKQLITEKESLSTDVCSGPLRIKGIRQISWQLSGLKLKLLDLELFQILNLTGTKEHKSTNM